MKKLVLLSFTVVALLNLVFAGPKGALLDFSYTKPYNYELVTGKYKVSAIIKSDCWADGMKISFNNEVLSVKKTG